MSDFRISGKTFFLTYPKSGNVTPEHCLRKVIAQFETQMADDGYAVVALEKHRDGTNHLHVIVHAGKNKKLDVRNKALFKALTGKSGNYQTAQSELYVLKYVTKCHRTCHYQMPDVDARIKLLETKSTTKSATIAMMVTSGLTVDDCADFDPGFTMMNLPKIQAFKMFHETRADRNAIVPPFFGIKCKTDCEATQLIVDWVNINVRKDRIFRQKQLWIHGPTLLGKTSLGNLLSNICKVYKMAYDSNWNDGYTDDYDLVWMDEYKSQKTLFYMNNFADGSSMKLPQRGVQAYNKQKKVAVLITSNSPIANCYPNASADEVAALAGRFLEVSVTEVIDVEVCPPPAAPQVPNSPPNPNANEEFEDFDDAYEIEYSPRKRKATMSDRVMNGPDVDMRFAGNTLMSLGGSAETPIVFDGDSDTEPCTPTQHQPEQEDIMDDFDLSDLSDYSNDEKHLQN